MSAEPPANSFRATLLSGGAGSQDPVVRTKRTRGENPSSDLTKVSIPRSESRSGNQRGGDRHRLTAEQAIVRIGRRDHKIELVNLSAGGAMVRGKLDVMLWDRAGLVLGEDGELDCAVRWIKGDDVGLEFAHETRIDCDRESRDELLRAVIRKSFPEVAFDPLAVPDLDEASEPQEDDEHRNAPRHPLIWNGVVYHDDIHDYDAEPVRLRNISATGALVQSSHDLTEGATIYLDLGATGRLEATVRWTRGGQSGLAFTEPFDLQSLDKSRPEVASDSRPQAFGKGRTEPWAEGWHRSTVDEMARSLGG
jgi:hypothetical protein